MSATDSSRLSVLRNDYSYLRNHLRVSGVFLAYLLQKKVIDPDEYEKLSSKTLTTNEKIDLLVLEYLLRGPDSDLDIIIEALGDSEQEYLAKRLRSLDKSAAKYRCQNLQRCAYPLKYIATSKTDINRYFLLVEAKANSPPPSEASPLKDQGHRAKELQKGA